MNPPVCSPDTKGMGDEMKDMEGMAPAHAGSPVMEGMYDNVKDMEAMVPARAGGGAVECSRCWLCFKPGIVKNAST